MELKRDLVVAMWWAKVAVLGHGVRERSNIFGKVRERNGWECLRRVGKLVWEGDFRAKVFFWVHDFVRKCLINVILINCYWFKNMSYIFGRT